MRFESGSRPSKSASTTTIAQTVAPGELRTSSLLANAVGGADHHRDSDLSAPTLAYRYPATRWTSDGPWAPPANHSRQDNVIHIL